MDQQKEFLEFLEHWREPASWPRGERLCRALWSCEEPLPVWASDLLGFPRATYSYAARSLLPVIRGMARLPNGANGGERVYRCRGCGRQVRDRMVPVGWYFVGQNSERLPLTVALFCGPACVAIEFNNRKRTGARSTRRLFENSPVKGGGAMR
jgi:hypothetical protein